MSMKQIIIAIDGPAGSGKSTTAKKLSEKLNYLYIDTGAMYRAVTIAWLDAGVEMTQEALSILMPKVNIELKSSANGQRTFLNGEDVSEKIRTSEVTKYSSPLSAVPIVRELLVDMQRDMGKKGAVILDGRDIGTVVFPQAELKIFLVASIEARASRRAKEMQEKGMEVSIEEIAKQIEIRDHNDSTRSHSPLKKAEDAIEIDTSNISIDEQVDMILKLALNKINK